LRLCKARHGIFCVMRLINRCCCHDNCFYVRCDGVLAGMASDLIIRRASLKQTVREKLFAPQHASRWLLQPSGRATYRLPLKISVCKLAHVKIEYSQG
jgi:hypothetical protein